MHTVNKYALTIAQKLEFSKTQHSYMLKNKYTNVCALKAAFDYYKNNVLLLWFTNLIYVSTLKRY